MKEYLLDLTTLITLISDICHDPDIENRYGNLEDWKNHNKSIYDHIIDEKENPVLKKIKEKVKEGKLLTTKPVWNKFEGMILRFGSDAEIQNMKNLKIEVIEDDKSEEYIFPSTRLWTEESRSIYGTASKYNYIIVTGNISVLTDAFKYNDHIEYIAHRSRCFVGKKNISNST